ncbi:Methylthioribose-1-phosphate isomerase [Geodia barretti]|uniref:Methylthioribose-1-phosphate isomerase n=1 Tax=Geodia barretti TaxID=519541 RepID=A0AA35WM06_GEOBA|nr:Methylthioribose-1-phosphate isomerase [Geodia barretti]
MNEIRPIHWDDGILKLLDQTRLPVEQVVVELDDYRGAVTAIRDMQVRGAPAIGVTAAYAVVMAAKEVATDDKGTFLDKGNFLVGLQEAAQAISAARPTAVNLQWAVRRMLEVAESEPDLSNMVNRLLGEAKLIQEEDEEINRRMGDFGKSLMPDGGSVLTHCNTGALATSAFGTALGVIRAGWETGMRFKVFNTETRPFLQGARLTAWEFQQLGIPATLIVDSAAGILMRQGDVSCVITGADRVAANGDTANKIGTYSLAVLAKENGIPFYVAAPTSTVDLSIPSGDEIQIEERAGSEVTHFQGAPTAPVGVEAFNPAFDVTPHRYISAIVTENGVVRAPFVEGLKLALGGP